MFAQTEGDNSWKTRVNCHNCGKKGHIAQECPERKQAGNQEHIHANIQEDGCNEDDIDKGENMFVQKREKGVVNKKMAPTGQSEHGGSSRQSSTVEEHQKGSQHSDRTLQCQIYQHQPGRRSRERDCEAQSP